jgi:NAD(P)-dependent dehydrogenase (short-subunit alcohol dehydrogenase family)
MGRRGPGGSRGLGLLVARELAREGYRVVICARPDSPPLALATTLGSSAAERLNERKAQVYPRESPEGRGR